MISNLQSCICFYIFCTQSIAPRHQKRCQKTLDIELWQGQNISVSQILRKQCIELNYSYLVKRECKQCSRYKPIQSLSCCKHSTFCVFKSKCKSKSIVRKNIVIPYCCQKHQCHLYLRQVGLKVVHHSIQFVAVNRLHYLFELSQYLIVAAALTFQRQSFV